jgi:hypothetical protein
MDAVTAWLVERGGPHYHMARMVSPARRREGKGIGERISELAVFAAIIAAAVWAGRWYFVVHRNSPTVALMSYMGALKSGNVDTQYKMLATSSKKSFPDQETYAKDYPLAQGLTGRMVDFQITKITETGDKAEADVVVPIRKPGQELYQAAATDYQDHYVLVKETGGWKVVLEKSKIKSGEAAGR